MAADYYAFLDSTPVGLKEDRFVQAVEVREVRIREQQVAETLGRPRAALGYSAVHHAGITASGGLEGVEQEDSELVGVTAGRFGLTHEAGQNATIYPDQLGVVLPAGSSLNWRIHTHSFGKEAVVRLDVAFKFHPKGYKPKYIVSALLIGSAGLSNHELDIPAGDDNARFDAIAVLQKAAKLVTFEPHMHAGGKRMCVQLTYPTGLRETLNCAGYNHNWVKVYTYEDDSAPLLPAGTIIQVIGWYDNSASNPRVSEPRNWKGFGSRSIDDMMFFIGKFVPLTEEQFKEEVATRAATPRVDKTTAHNQQ